MSQIFLKGNIRHLTTKRCQNSKIYCKDWEAVEMSLFILFRLWLIMMTIGQGRGVLFQLQCQPSTNLLRSGSYQMHQVRDIFQLLSLVWREMYSMDTCSTTCFFRARRNVDVQLLCRGEAQPPEVQLQREHVQPHLPARQPVLHPHLANLCSK